MTISWRICSSRSRPSALAVIDLRAQSGEELERALTKISGQSTSKGNVSLRSLAGVDQGVIARCSETAAVLMPHGGPAVIEALHHAFGQLGFHHAPRASARHRFPEAHSDIEAEMLAALSRAASPLAVEHLLAQPARWQDEPPRPADDRDRRLNHLIDPPLVAAVGPPNVGKSSLFNALVGRAAARVADEPGTTRDHVGAAVDLAGVVVHWVDTPGRREADGVEARAISSAEPIIAAADLVLAIGDASSEDPKAICLAEPELVVASRSDLGRPTWTHDLAVSARTREGLAELVATIRDRLVRREDLDSAKPWRFWDEPDTSPGPNPLYHAPRPAVDGSRKMRRNNHG